MHTIHMTHGMLRQLIAYFNCPDLDMPEAPRQLLKKFQEAAARAAATEKEIVIAIAGEEGALLKELIGACQILLIGFTALEKETLAFSNQGGDSILKVLIRRSYLDRGKELSPAE